MKQTCIFVLIVTLLLLVPFSATGVDKVLTGLTISGPSSVGTPGVDNYIATAYFSDGSSQNVTLAAQWWENSAYAFITRGSLKTLNPPSGHQIQITIYYVYNGTARNAYKTVTTMPK